MNLFRTQDAEGLSAAARALMGCVTACLAVALTYGNHTPACLSSSPRVSKRYLSCMVSWDVGRHLLCLQRGAVGGFLSHQGTNAVLPWNRAPGCAVDGISRSLDSFLLDHTPISTEAGSVDSPGMATTGDHCGY